jgi:hypothetical protein
MRRRANQVATVRPGREHLGVAGVSSIEPIPRRPARVGGDEVRAATEAESSEAAGAGMHVRHQSIDTARSLLNRPACMTYWPFPYLAVELVSVTIRRYSSPGQPSASTKTKGNVPAAETS